MPARQSQESPRAVRYTRPVRAQGLLFTEDLPELDEEVGYRGPTACKAAGITYRQLDYWARTGLVEPGVRGALRLRHRSGSTGSATSWC